MRISLIPDFYPLITIYGQFTNKSSTLHAQTSKTRKESDFMNSLLRKILFYFLILGFFITQNSALTLAAVGYDELVTFAKQLESSISSGNPYYFNHCFDTDSLISRVVVNQKENTFNEAFADGFVEGLKQEFDLGAAIVKEISSEGSFTFIRAYQQNNKSKILFRLVSDYGINYHEYEVESRDSKLMITDGYIFTSARTISNTFEQIYTAYLLNIYHMAENRMKRNAEQKISHLAEAGKSAQAYKKWKKLPNYIRYSKSNQILGINLAKELDKKAYFETYIEFTQHFPDEPGKYFIPLDGLIKHGYYQAALINIDKLDEIVQADPLINVFRANIYCELDEVEKAETCLNQLIESRPEFETGYINLLRLYLEKKEFGKATELLDKMAFTFDASKEDLLPFVVNHTDFINSAEYKDWLDE